jgi:hypothetical protein
MVMSRALVRFGNARTGLIAFCAALAALVVLSAGARAATYPISSPSLPDNRGYEKVSPTNNNDGDVASPISASLSTSTGGFNYQPFVAAADGEALAYMADPPEKGGGGHEGASGGNQYVATRGPAGGWTAVDVTPPSQNFYDFPVYQGFSKNLSVGFLVSKLNTPLAPGAPSGGYNVPYVHDFTTGGYESLLLGTPPNRGTNEFGNSGWHAPGVASGPYPEMFAGASSDFSHVLYQANDALTPDAIAGGPAENDLYDYHQGALALVNVLPDGSPEPNATFGGPTVAPDNPIKNGPALTNAISEDGSRIFWTGLGENHNLYLREDDERTVQVDASVGGEGQFWSATPDGAKALFTRAGDLYQYDVEDRQTIDLVPGAEVQGVLGTSRDMSYVYFVARGALAPGAEPQECEASSGLCNLYVIHGETVKFIGALGATDNRAGPNTFGMQAGPWQASPGAKESQVSPDGLHLVFGTKAPLTGYDNVYSGERDEEVYVYDFEGSKLTCVSCNPTGEPPAHVYSAFLPTGRMSSYSHRWMSEDGNRVFFDSLDALVPQDTNGLSDVYEWERDGSGDCLQVNGCIYLLTAGVGSEGSYLIDISVSANDVFFTTRSKLVAEDENENVDAYDARVGAAVPPAAPSCSGTGCQGTPSAPPIFATPASVTYNGVGNFAAPSKTTASKPKSKTKKKLKKKPKKKTKRAKTRTKSRRATASKRGGDAVRSGMSHGRSK